MADSIDESTTWPRRLRATVLLVLLITVLGAVAAATVGLVAVALTSLIDQALG